MEMCRGDMKRGRWLRRVGSASRGRGIKSSSVGRRGGVKSGRGEVERSRDSSSGGGRQREYSWVSRCSAGENAW